jgi:mercuric ion binding protein
MKRFVIIAVGALALGVGGIASLTIAAQPVQAAIRAQTAKFAIAKMTCATCPVTVNKAMRGVKGVRSVNIDFKAKTAIVEFDPAETSPARIAAASTNAGYPAKLSR